jgi:hypothetical protein
MDADIATRELPQGVLIVGRFAGVEGDSFPRILVECKAVGRTQPFRRQVDYSGFSRGTGEPTEVGKIVGDLDVGDLVAVTCFVDCKSFNRKVNDPQGRWRAGEVFWMVTYSATAVVRLDG